MPATGHTGAVTLVQRFGSVLNLNIHFHLLFLDGVFRTAGVAAPVFREVPRDHDWRNGGRCSMTCWRPSSALRRRKNFRRPDSKGQTAASMAPAMSVPGAPVFESTY